MVLGLGFKGAILGIGVESIWGTPLARTQFVELNSESIIKEIEPIHSEAIPAIYRQKDEFSLGAITVGGEAELEMRYEGMETLIKHAMGSVASVEVASFAVTSGNKYFDFKEDAGSALVGTVAESTYVMGSSDADAGSLCAAIKTALEATGSGTYSITFSNVTKKITIAVSGAVSSVQFLWKTGTHGSDNTDDHIGTLIGFNDNADSADQASHVADNAVITVFNHTFTLTDDLPTGLTLEIDRDTDASVYPGAKVNTMAMTVELTGFLKSTIGVIAKDETIETVTSSTLPTSELIVFHQGAINYNAGTIYVKNLEFTLNNNLLTDRRFVGSRLIFEPQRSAKIEVTGSFSMEFESRSQYNDFIAGTTRVLIATFTGSEIKSGQNYSLIITFPNIRLSIANPTIPDEGPMMIDAEFTAYAEVGGTSREFNVTLKNTAATVA